MSRWRDYQQQIEIGDMFLQAEKYDMALAQYRSIPEKWYEPPTPRLYYKMAAANAGLSDSTKAVDLLNKAVQGGRQELAQFALVDPAFDKIRNTLRFQKFIKNLSSRGSLP